MRALRQITGVPLLPRLVIFACSALYILSVERVSATEQLDVLNPGFEIAEENGLAGWRLVTDPATVSRSEGVATVATLTQDTTHVKEGSASAKIHHEGPRWAALRQDVSLIGGATYRLRVFASAKESGDKKIRIVARFFVRDQGENLISSPDEVIHLTPSGEWQEISQDFTIPDTISSGDKVWLELKAILTDPKTYPSDIWFDDVSVERIDG